MSVKQIGLVHLKSASETTILFIGSIIWPMIDSYYVTLMYTLSMLRNKGVESVVINKKIQHLAETLFASRAINYFESCN
jgi:hypothetical protein